MMYSLETVPVMYSQLEKELRLQCVVYTSFLAKLGFVISFSNGSSFLDTGYKLSSQFSIPAETVIIFAFSGDCPQLLASC